MSEWYKEFKEKNFKTAKDQIKQAPKQKWKKEKFSLHHQTDSLKKLKRNNLQYTDLKLK